MADSETLGAFEKLFSALFSLPVIVLIIILIFRQQILRFFGLIESKVQKQEFSELSIGKDGVSAKFIKAETAIGETNVSVSKFSQNTSNDNLVIYTSGLYKFRIGWDEKKYYGTTETQLHEDFLHQNVPSLALASVPIFIERKELFLGFLPNVNVLAQSIEPTTTITKTLHLGIQGLKASGFEIISTNIDTESQSGLIEYSLAGGNNIQFAKFVVQKDMSYAVTATASNPADPTQKGLPADLLKKAEIKNELRTILNSFELVA